MYPVDFNVSTAKWTLFLTNDDLFHTRQTTIVLAVAQHHRYLFTQVVLVCTQLAVKFILQI